MNRRAMFALLWAWVVVALGISVHRHGFWATVQFMAWFWGAWFACAALFWVNERVIAWRESRQEVQQ